jgi:SAM-dependent methyltransferase
MWRCTGCGFVFAVDRHIPPGLYDSAYADGGGYTFLARRIQQLIADGSGADWMHQWVFDQIHPFGEKRLLDLGCSSGSALYLGKKAGWQPHGQDASKEALKIAHELVGATTYDTEISDLIAAGQTFDLVTAFNLIEHLPDPMQYLTDMRKLVAPGGMVAVAVPNYNSYTMRHTPWDLWLPPYHINFFSLNNLSEALQRSGFQILRHKIRFLSLSGFPGSRVKQLLYMPYLLGNAAIGRLNGNGIVCTAKAI